MEQNNIIEVEKICIDYKMKKFDIRAVDDVDFVIPRGKITALVGESGSGKTTLATSLFNCLSEPGVITSGKVMFYGKDGTVDVAKLTKKELERFRWKNISMVFQGAQSALNPVMSIFEQFQETLLVHNAVKSREEALKISRHYLEFVNLDADRVLEAYPHELSGGMKQRVMIAFALLLEPELILLDEPTTALDVITQKYIFELLKKINVELGISMLLLTHDISIVARYADYVGVMYGGKVVEYGTVYEVFSCSYHPYTRGLINATPSLIKPLSELRPIEGSPPNLLNMPSGCAYHPRCRDCMAVCKEKKPEMHVTASGEKVLCHLFDKKEGSV